MQVELRTDYLNGTNEHVISTTANGQEMGSCSQWSYSPQSAGGAVAAAERRAAIHVGQDRIGHARLLRGQDSP